MRWQFTDVEFKSLCHRYRYQGRMPSPLVYLSRTVLADDYARELSEIRARLDQELDQGFVSLFKAVADPEVFIGVHGFQDNDPSAPRLRVHGARRGHHACVISQAPGETTSHSGDITVIECDPHELPALLVRHLPEVEPGRQSPIAISEGPAIPEPDPYDAPPPSAFDSFEESNDARALRFWNTQADRMGFMRIVQGRSKYGPRGVEGQLLLWRDLPDDGRYMIELETPEMAAVGTDAKRFESRLQHHVDRILKIMESRGEHEELAHR
ncbi:ESX secretion-associated protein EspG [Nocardia sp. NPDC005978]|uniref:ESX secretion-associated protein EspG n=1 Tax=Nocardia sp. NPDC005978 TaxID=3156725 RepID=UPI0033A2B80E